MALEVFVSPFLGVVFENLSSLILDEIGVVLGVNKELEKLSNTLSTIRDVLEDAEIKQIHDKPINNWLRKLKDLAYEADDILDECATEVSIPESEVVRNISSNIQVTSPSDSSCFDVKGIMFRRSIGKRIKKLSEKFDEMDELRTKFQLNSSPKHVESGKKEQRETSSRVSEPQVYGREEEKEHIANLLLKGGDEVVSVCCIVGMGGLGKTTLAQSVYNDENIANHFQLKCWVCVSEDFVLKTLLKSIIESISGNEQDLKDLDPLERCVEGILSGKKFLLVLDDVWNEDQTKWYKLKSLLTCGGKGSSIIVTTRLESVASIMGSTTLSILRLKTLSEGNCWSLFKHYAFDTENENHHPMLEEIGKEIVKKCGGVPLAAKALGGLLRFEKTENGWLRVRDSALWDHPQDKEDAILPALRLSYNNLSSPLKQCFSYCSIFPKDYIMNKEDLIHLWMANGFVHPKENMELEDIGNEIFNQLLWRSFFQEAEKDQFNHVVGCKMHDLVHDLACSITLNECTFVEYNKEKSFCKPSSRHLSLTFGFSFLSTNLLNLCLSKSQPQLRTFFQLHVGSWYEHAIQGVTFSNLKCLRVLDLSHTDINTLHVSISNLKHLRYLDLSYCKYLRSLSNECICSLRNLQVLKLDKCESLQVLPSNIRKMTNLRHIGISGCKKLRRMPVGIGNLRCLRRLSMFIIVPKNGCDINELEGLDHLTGKLEIHGLQHVRNLKDAKNANLIRKKSLDGLKLFWSEENNGNIEVGEGLQPHSNIKKLHLECYNGLNFPNWLSHSCLPNLVKISLVDCRRCEHLPSPLGRLAFLEFLKISGMDSMKCIGDEFYGDYYPQGSFFPTLKRFEICKMPNLEEWYAPLSSKEEENTKGGELQVFPSLEDLMLEGCPKLRTIPTTLLSAVTRLELKECNEMMLETLPPNSSWSCCLKKLEIGLVDKIETLPKMLLENLPTTLTHLRINGGKELVCLPARVMQNLTCLKFFEIRGCGRLKYLPELGSKNTALTSLRIQGCVVLTSVSDCLRHLTTLEYLMIISCPELEFLLDDFQDLKSLRDLDISWLPQMTCLPEGLQQVAGTLESLYIYSCSGLTSLPEWMDKFTSLRRLEIMDCENLKVLPEQVLHLTTLEDVTILDCHPELGGRYTKETGKDWHKIAHIPNLTIGETTLGKRMNSMHNNNKSSINIPCFSSSSGTN